MRQYIFLVFVVLLAAPLQSFADKGDKSKTRSRKDTAMAVVVYGDSALVSMNVELRDETYRRQLDSLLLEPEFDSEKLKQLKLIRSVERKNEGQVATMIDSLFSLEEVPYALINEINLYVAMLREKRGSASVFPTDWASASPHPADVYYNHWNTEKPDPYQYTTEELDSVVVLKLLDSIDFCDFAHPHLGKVTSQFGWRYGRAHKGIDVDLEVWDPVHSAFAGQVRVAKYYGGYGRVVVVRHYNGLETLYAHLHRFKVSAGDYVEAGDVIGLGGSSGRSTGSHLHFEVRFKGVPVNPENLICFQKGELIGDTLELCKAPHWYAARTSNTTVHRVEKGEYLHKIATRYGVTIQHICELNGIRRNTTLRVGQRLKIVG